MINEMLIENFNYYNLIENNLTISNCQINLN